MRIFADCNFVSFASGNHKENLESYIVRFLGRFSYCMWDESVVGTTKYHVGYGEN